ncbi:hypothetical protein PIROE2DRAFT_16717 [Piromyces sp. E2]|nr:hypothetical protein PIROE2DRAFT_16717 [Piromyces sp. E2]|eukprot:OUM58104.1 hypothetical protein PIROE2DRAFT_16717 [Piromyces sp. E2]
MDNEVPTLRVTLPDDEFKVLKEKSNYYSMPVTKFNIATFIDEMYLKELDLLEQLSQINYGKQFPGVNFDELLPELNIGEDGLAHYNSTEILEGINITKENILQYDFSKYDIMEFSTYVLSLNTKFNFIRNIAIINQLEAAMMQQNEISSQNKNEGNSGSIFTNSTITSGMPTQPPLSEPEVVVNEDEFKTKNATMTFEINK